MGVRNSGRSIFANFFSLGGGVGPKKMASVRESSLLQHSETIGSLMRFTFLPQMSSVK